MALRLPRPRRPRPDPLPSPAALAAAVAEGERRMNLDPRPCLLCEGPPVELGFFVATDAAARRFGRPPGEPLGISFTLCKECSARPDLKQAVEVAMAKAANALPLMN